MALADALNPGAKSETMERTFAADGDNGVDCGANTVTSPTTPRTRIIGGCMTKWSWAYGEPFNGERGWYPVIKRGVTKAILAMALGMEVSEFINCLSPGT